MSRKTAGRVDEPPVPPAERSVAYAIEPWRFCAAIDLLNSLPTALEQSDSYSRAPCRPIHTASLKDPDE